jgi:dTMP kinase
MAQGSFFVIDGTDGSGKKTQTGLLIERLRREGYPVETISFPQYGRPSAGPTEEYLAGAYGSAQDCGPKCASIFYAVDRFAASQQIRDWLKAGKFVIADRYVSSNMGHQGGKIKDPTERTEFLRWNEELEYDIFHLPRPDLTLILHVPAEIGQALAKKRDVVQDIHQRDLNHLKDAEQAYLEIAGTLPGFRLVECVKRDKLLSRKEIHDLVWEELRPYLKQQPAPKIEETSPLF